ncbi:MAG: insulinase family protein [Chloroflexota bacterium]|jgi:Zn-dependent M16 (insulinase) family peptidase
MADFHGFILLEERVIKEYNTRACLWQHQLTGAQLLSLENDDENKVFGISFRTPPPDSSGVPHILEHSVLCGSQKYPVKEPFVELLKGSLNTFLNAMTYPDKTLYPVASTNLKDFYNLIDVYLDAVFHPLISPYTLYQEGWHYELDEPQAEMIYKGVVYNEMKGAYSSPDSILAEESQHALFPDTIYRYDSGGNPEEILSLTYDDFRAFFETYYHPSNALFYFYGDDPLDQRLEMINRALAGFERREVSVDIPLQARFSSPAYTEVYYDSGDDPNARSQVGLSWMLFESGNVEQTLALHLLDHALIGTPASPLRKALIDSGLGEDLTSSGFQSGYRQTIFSVGLKGIAAENAALVQNLIMGTLTEIAEQGFDPETLRASLNTFEFSLRENNTGPYPRGLVMMLNAVEDWVYGHNPIEPLEFERPLNAIKQRFESGQRYFEDLIRTHLLENTHRVTLLLRPDPELGKQRAAAEQERLRRAREAMKPAEIDEVVAITRELKLRQETPDSPEALATIPMLQRSDLDPKIKTIPTEEVRLANSAALLHNLFTNGILYFDLGFDLHTLPGEWLPYLPVFSRALLETGTAQHTFVQLMQQIGQRTGGIYPTMLFSMIRGSVEDAAWLFLRGKAMIPQSRDLFMLLKDVLFTARLNDRDRIRQIALENKAGIESGIVHAGHRVVNSRLKARFTSADWAGEVTGGISQLFFLRNLLDKIDSDWDSVHQMLENIRAALLNQQALICNLTLDTKDWQQVRPLLEDFVAAFPDTGYQPAAWNIADLPGVEGLSMPLQVNFVGKGGNLYQNGYSFHGSALVIVPYLRGSYLWDKVRVQGGAYGGFAVFDQQSGNFNFLSYRDPNLDQTLHAYDQTADYLRRLELSDSELTKAIIGAIGEVDAHQLPDAKGYTAMLRRLLKISNEDRQRTRDQILATSQADFRAFASALEAVSARGAVVVLASSESLKSSQMAEQFSLLRIL